MAALPTLAVIFDSFGGRTAEPVLPTGRRCCADKRERGLRFRKRTPGPL